MEKILLRKTVKIFREAEILLEQNKFSSVLDLIKKHLLLMPGDADAYVITASALIGMGRIDEARDILKDVDKIISEFSFAFERIGDIYRKKVFIRMPHYVTKNFFLCIPVLKTRE